MGLDQQVNVDLRIKSPFGALCCFYVQQKIFSREVMREEKRTKQMNRADIRIKVKNTKETFCEI